MSSIFDCRNSFSSNLEDKKRINRPKGLSRTCERERPLGGKISNVDRKRFDYEVLKMQDKKMTEQVEEGDDILYLITNGS